MFYCSYFLIFLLLRLSNYECVKSRPFPGFNYAKSDGLSGDGQGYPSSGGSHGYPTDNELSGNSHIGAGQTTNVHYDYNYNPPQQILYTSTRGGPPVKYPVYRGSPPNYVYQYKDSGSKYGTLLAGLALLNLGTLGVSAYAPSKSHSNYTPKPGEFCTFAINKDNEALKEFKIDCNLISSFIYQEEAKTQGGAGTNTRVVTTVTNVTTINASNGNEPALPPVNANSLYEMSLNGTLVPVNVTAVNTTANSNNTDDAVTSSVTRLSLMTVPNALDVKGEPIDITPRMYCYVTSNSPDRNIMKSVSCGLLQLYAEQSLKKNSASRNFPVIPIFTAVFSILTAY